MYSKNSITLPLLVAIAAVVSIGLWVLGASAVSPVIRVERADDLLSSDPSMMEVVDLRGTFTRGPGQPGQSTASWPGFRGPTLDNISREEIRLARTWPESGPQQLWSVELGEGYAGAAVHNGRVYLLDYDMKLRGDVLRCLSLADGREIWRHFYPVDTRRNHGMSRTVPAVTDRFVVAFGPKGHVICLDSETGEFQWGIDLVVEHGTEVPPWYAGQCPLIDGDRVILAPGGPDALLMAVEIETGEIIWKTPNPDNWRMTHSSIAPVTIDGVKMYIYCTSGGIVAVSAEDGSILWQTDEWRISIANVPTPVPVGDGRIFFTGGYNAGAMMLRVNSENGAFTPEIIFRLRPRICGSVNQTPILYEDYIYCVIPNGQLACLDLDGQTIWTSGSTNRFGIGPYLIADGMLFLLDDNATLTLAEATPAGYIQLAREEVLDGFEAWAPMAIADGKLILRDFTTMICLDVREQR